MQPDWNATTVPQSGAPTIAVDVSAQQRVLRNTYWMLALTMIPTVIGALMGASFAFGPLFKAYPIMAPIGMFLVMLGLLFGVSAFDPTTYVAAGVVVMTVGLLAATLPALRASRIDPVRALRQE